MLFDQRHKDGADCHDQQDAGDRTGEEQGPVTLAVADGLAEVVLHLAAQNEGQDEGRGGDAGIHHVQADRDEEAGHDDVGDVEGLDVNAQQAEGQDGRIQEVIRCIQQLGEPADAEDLDQQAEDRGQQSGQEDHVGEHRVILLHQGAGLDAVDGQAAQQHCRGAVTGDAQCDHGDDCAADGSIVRDLRSPDTIGDAGAELFRMLGGVLGGCVGHHVGQGSAHAGQEADAQTDEEGADDVGDVGTEVTLLDLEAGQLAVKGRLGAVDTVGVVHDDQGTGEDTDHDAGHGEAAGQIVTAEGEALGGGDGSVAHLSEQQAHACADEALDHVALGDGDHQGDGHEGQGEVLPGAHLDGHRGDQGAGDHGDDDGGCGAQEVGQRTDGQSAGGLALLGHGVAVKGSRQRRGGAGDAQQDGTDEGTGAAADPDGHQQGECLGGLHGERDGQHDRDGQTGCQTGDRAQDDTDQHAHEAHDKGRRLKQQSQSR